MIVAGTELTIRWNNINGMYSASSAGQLIPLFVGIAATSCIIYRAVKDRLKKRLQADKPTQTPPTIEVQKDPYVQVGPTGPYELVANHYQPPTPGYARHQ
jgi:hypothetical protein